MGGVLEDVAVDSSAAGGFKPRSAMARFDLPQDEGDATEAIKLEFVDATPINESLDIGINSADPIAYSP